MNVPSVFIVILLFVAFIHLLLLPYRTINLYAFQWHEAARVSLSILFYKQPRHLLCCANKTHLSLRFKKVSETKEISSNHFEMPVALSDWVPVSMLTTLQLGFCITSDCFACIHITLPASSTETMRRLFLGLYH